MKQGDYSGYIGKHVVCAVAEFSSNGKSGIVTHADSYGWLTVDWDIPDKRHGKQGLLAVNEIRVIEKKEIQIVKQRNCDGVECKEHDCPIDCCGDYANVVGYAKKWLAEHPITERKLNEQWVEKCSDGKMHMYKAVPSRDVCDGCCFSDLWSKTHCRHETGCPIDPDESIIIKDLGILNEDGCLPAPWDSTKYPKITVLIGNVYNIEVMEGFWFMQVRGDTKEKAIERWNRRS